MLDEKERELLEHLNFRFIANPIPDNVKEELFDAINEKTKIKKLLKRTVTKKELE